MDDKVVVILTTRSRLHLHLSPISMHSNNNCTKGMNYCMHSCITMFDPNTTARCMPKILTHMCDVIAFLAFRALIHAAGMIFALCLKHIALWLYVMYCIHLGMLLVGHLHKKRYVCDSYREAVREVYFTN